MLLVCSAAEAHGTAIMSPAHMMKMMMKLLVVVGGVVALAGRGVLGKAIACRSDKMM